MRRLSWVVCADPKCNYEGASGIHTSKGHVRTSEGASATEEERKVDEPTGAAGETEGELARPCCWLYEGEGARSQGAQVAARTSDAQLSSVPQRFSLDVMPSLEPCGIDCVKHPVHSRRYYHT